ncbi:MAG: hypothetical protein M3N93_05010 [Acidobacteriota bacterium]|nr:hypothetical protein [Acidobacteriota bacterium]
MRTTLSLDDDVASLLITEIRLTTPAPRRKAFKVRPRSLGLPEGLSYDRIEDLIESLESRAHL